MGKRGYGGCSDGRAIGPGVESWNAVRRGGKEWTRAVEGASGKAETLKAETGNGRAGLAAGDSTLRATGHVQLLGGGSGRSSRRFVGARLNCPAGPRRRSS